MPGLGFHIQEFIVKEMRSPGKTHGTWQTPFIDDTFEIIRFLHRRHIIGPQSCDAEGEDAEGPEADAEGEAEGEGGEGAEAEGDAEKKDEEGPNWKEPMKNNGPR